MLIYIKENKDTQALFVQHTDRLARDLNVHGMIKKELRENEVDIYSLMQGKIENTPDGNMVDGMIAVVSAYQREITAYKTERAIEQKIEKGWLPRKAPLGYKNVRDENENGIIVIDEEKAPLVRMAFNLYVTGEYGAETINDILYEKGFRSMTGKKLEVSKLYYLLENPFYIGQFRWKGKPYDGSHKPLITEEVFNLAQHIRQSRTIRKNYERKHNFLLSSFMFCKCGRRFTAEKHKKPSGRRYAYYHCTRGRKCHDSFCVPCEDLEKQVEERFKEVQFSEEFYKKLLDKLKQKYDSRKESRDEEIKSLTRKKKEVEKKRDKAEQALFNGDITKAVYQRNSEKFESEIQTYEDGILKLNRTKEINIGAFEELADFAKDVYSAYKNNGYNVQRKYLGFFWDRFIVEGRQIIEARPTLLFQALQELKNNDNSEEEQKSCQNSKISECGNSIVNLVKGDLKPQTVAFIPAQKNFGNGVINPMVWGA